MRGAFFLYIYVTQYFLDIVSPNNDMLGKMRTLFSNYPEVDLFLKTLVYTSLCALCPS